MIEFDLEGTPEELIQAEKFIVEGKFEEAHELMDKFKERGEYTPKDALICDLLEVDIMFQQGLYEDVIKLADQTYKESIKLRENALASDALNLETIALILLHNMDDCPEKIKEGKELLKIIAQELPREYKKRRAALEYVKFIYCFYKREVNEIKKHLDASVALLEEIAENRLLADVLITSIMYYALLKGEFDLSLDNLEKGLDISNKINYKYGIASGLLAKGVVSSLKGDIDYAILYHEQSLTICRELNNKFYIAQILNNLADQYRVKGDLERALECIESSIDLYNKEGDIQNLAMAHDNLIQILIDKNDPEQAWKAIEQLEQIKNQLDDKTINLQYLLDKALVLKISSRSRNRIEAEDILKQIIEDKTIIFEDAIRILLNLCELLLTELRMTNDLSVLEEIDIYIVRLLEIAENSHSFILFAEIYFLKAKLALITLDMKNARRFLTQAQRVAERFGINQLAAKISKEHEKLLNQLMIWDDLREKEISLSDRMKLAGMNEQMEHLLRNRESLTTQVKEKQITVFKERKICTVCKGDILGFMYTCKCDALYCDKCIQAITELENICWVCNAPIDVTKPIKPYKQEEVGIEDIIKKNHKKPKNDDSP